MASGAHGLGPTRAKVLTLLQASPGPIQAIEVAEQLDLHKNSARFHLDALVAAGYAERSTADTGQLGRPPLLFAASGNAPSMSDLHLLEVTEVLLAQFVTPAPDASTRAEAAGRQWGTDVAAEDDSSDDLFEDLVEHLAERGFGTSHDPAAGTLIFGRCPFRDSISAEQLPMMCAMHQGFLDGYLDTSGSGLKAGRLQIGPVTCTAEIAATKDPPKQ